ncbi:hypothetical protein [Bdellovibrio sp. NC01]|uniref:hypothetical protein n=1 Tax=Bdellovibrio sp. NC01 TaxID=2220073 RepID=UPI001159BB7D|nr:hypothetical protein [Bdellovibrio sp. NC01]QDK36897.1 hypothetical protein DOE51_04475 [Bdellovibrio sp. NC01]
MKVLISILVLLPSLGFAAVKRVTDYKSVSCTLSKNETKLEEKKDLNLLLLSIEDHLGKFAQVAFTDGQTKLQYQLLIEDDVTSKTMDAFVVLQNLKVGDKEISSEFAAKDLQWASINDGTYKVSCTLSAPQAVVEQAPKVDSATHD